MDKKNNYKKSNLEDLKKLVYAKLMGRLFLIALCALFFLGCYKNRGIRQTDPVEKLYLNQEFVRAVDTIRPMAEKAGTKDRLLFLLEAGSILHTMGAYAKSNAAFLAAEEIVETTSKKLGLEIQAFFLSQRSQNYVGENFEHVLLRLQIALNYLMLSESADSDAERIENRKNALRYFRRVNQILAEMAQYDQYYKQNYGARYLHALLAEELGNLNDARVQYNNLMLVKQYNAVAKTGKNFVELLAAITERDTLGDFENGKLENKDFYTDFKGQFAVYKQDENRKLVRVENLTLTDFQQLGSLVWVNENGMAPVRVSRGKLKKSAMFKDLLLSSVRLALVADGRLGISSALILAVVGEAENPIPRYERRKNIADVFQPLLLVEQVAFPNDIFYNHGKVAIKHFDDDYEKLVKKNASSLGVKIATSIIATEVAAANSSNNGLEQFFIGLMGGVVAGVGVKATIAPDLRSWNMVYDNLQISRIFLLPGVYRLGITDENGNLAKKKWAGANGKKIKHASGIPTEIKIEPGKTKFILQRSF